MPLKYAIILPLAGIIAYRGMLAHTLVIPFVGYLLLLVAVSSHAVADVQLALKHPNTAPSALYVVVLSVAITSLGFLTDQMNSHVIINCIFQFMFSVVLWYLFEMVRASWNYNHAVSQGRRGITIKLFLKGEKKEVLRRRRERGYKFEHPGTRRRMSWAGRSL